MDSGRSGYTLKELLAVVVTVGVLTLVAIPKFSLLEEHSRVSAAREELTSAIATARATAIRRGQNATLFLQGNRMWVTADAQHPGGSTTVLPVQSFKTLYNVAVVPANPAFTQVTFDRHGFLSPRLASIGVVRITGATRTDSICLTRAGRAGAC